MAPADAYAVLAERHGYPKSARYLKILEFLMTPQQARIAADLPSAPEEIAQRHGIPLPMVKAELETLFLKGVVFPKDFKTLEFPRFARSVYQLHDASQSILDLDAKLYNEDSKKEFYRLWEDFCEEEWYPDRLKEMAKAPRPPLRVVAAYRAIKDIPGIEPYDDMREIIKAQETMALCSCTCRKRRTLLGMACEHTHDANCFQFNRGAEYAIARGSGRNLTQEQMVKLLDETEEDGLVHTWRNDRSMSMPVFCSCCIDCCMVWHPIDTHHGNIGWYWAKSRFQAQIDDSHCTGCQTCVDRCMFNAIEMVKVPGSKKLKAKIDPEKCFGCGVCAIKCEHDALILRMVRTPEHIAEAMGAPGP
jgi:Pyruvate/2-oxoacid:ferredoxin oxidoreductase delta subunit